MIFPAWKDEQLAKNVFAADGFLLFTAVTATDFYWGGGRTFGHEIARCHCIRSLPPRVFGTHMSCRMRLAFSQYNAVTALLDVNREAALQKPKERVGVVGAKTAANANGSNRRIFDDDFADTVAIEVGDRVG